MLNIPVVLMCFAPFFLSGCTLFLTPPQNETDLGQQSVEPQLYSAQFQKENLPVRTLRIGLIGDGKLTEEQLLRDFREASHELTRQTGIALDVSFDVTSRLSSAGPVTMIAELDLYHRTQPSYDIVVGVALRTPEELEVCGPNCYSGMTPRDHMILLHTTWSPVIIHEFGHAFLGWGHSPTGVMQSAVSSLFFSVNDRERMLENKWKTFGPPQNLDAY